MSRSTPCVRWVCWSERMFAYYEDDDMGAGVIAGGWRTPHRLECGRQHAHVLTATCTSAEPYFFI